MADEQAKNSANLGELFVEFGSKGMGGLIKGLNTVSASFLLTKNAAQQMLSPLANMSKQAGQGVVGLDKLNSVTGISIKQLQRLKQWTTLNNIDFNDYIGQVHSLQNALGRMALGDSGAIQGFAMLGLNPSDFNPAKPLENMQKVKNAMLSMYQSGGEKAKFQIALALQLLGLNEDLAYAFMNANKHIDESILLTKEQTDNLRDQNDAWNALKVASSSFFEKVIAESGWLTKGIEKATEKIVDLIHKFDEYNQKKRQGLISEEEKKYRNHTTLMEAGAAFSSIGVGIAAGGALGGPIGAGIGGILGGLAGIAEMRTISKSRKENMSAALDREKVKQAYQAIDRGDNGYSSINYPTAQGIGALNNKNRVIPFNNIATDNRKAEININVEQTVTGENAQQSANDVINIIQDNLYTQLGFNFIANNNGGFNR